MEAAAVSPCREGSIYVILFSGYYKIGRAKNVDARLRSVIPIKFPVPPVLKLSIAVDNAPLAEWALHQKFQDKRVAGEWFTLDDGDINQIRGFLTAKEYLEYLEYQPAPKVKRTRPPKDESKEARKNRLIAQNKAAAEARMSSIRDVPRLLRHLSLGSAISVRGQENKAIISSIGRKFNYCLSISEYTNVNGLHVFHRAVRGSNWIATVL